MAGRNPTSCSCFRMRWRRNDCERSTRARSHCRATRWTAIGFARRCHCRRGRRRSCPTRMSSAKTMRWRKNWWSSTTRTASYRRYRCRRVRHRSYRRMMLSAMRWNWTTGFARHCHCKRGPRQSCRMSKTKKIESWCCRPRDPEMAPATPPLLRKGKLTCDSQNASSADQLVI